MHSAHQLLAASTRRLFVWVFSGILIFFVVCSFTMISMSEYDSMTREQ